MPITEAELTGIARGTAKLINGATEPLRAEIDKLRQAMRDGAHYADEERDGEVVAKIRALDGKRHTRQFAETIAADDPAPFDAAAAVEEWEKKREALAAQERDCIEPHELQVVVQQLRAVERHLARLRALASCLR